MLGQNQKTAWREKGRKGELDHPVTKTKVTDQRTEWLLCPGKKKNQAPDTSGEENQ